MRSASLPAPVPDVARQAMPCGERLASALRARLLPVLLGQLAGQP